MVDEERGRIFATIKNNFEAYDYNALRPSPWDPDKTGFIGVWSVTDNGDVPPRGVTKGPASGLVWPAGVAINPASHEVYAIRQREQRVVHVQEAGALLQTRGVDRERGMTAGYV